MGHRAQRVLFLLGLPLPRKITDSRDAVVGTARTRMARFPAHSRDLVSMQRCYWQTTKTIERLVRQMCGLCAGIVAVDSDPCSLLASARPSTESVCGHSVAHALGSAGGAAFGHTSPSKLAFRRKLCLVGEASLSKPSPLRRLDWPWVCPGG